MTTSRTGKSLRTWVREHRPDIDGVARTAAPGVHLNDEEREEWVLNDEGLYLWAKGEGVDLDS